MQSSERAWYDPRRGLVRFMLFVLFVNTAHGTLVTVQSQTQEQMDALTAVVNQAAASDHSGSARMTLGTI